jgi:transcriptional regulator with XRE-family HTH domain
MITPIQSKMARVALGWGTRELAAAAGVGASTVMRFETGKVNPNRATLAAIRRALEDAGVEFLDDDGLRLRRPHLKPLAGVREVAAAA